MNAASWPALDQVLAILAVAPSRTGSVIATIYGDAILPRGGSLALADLLALMRRVGTPDGVVRTAVSRLAKEGLLEGRRVGRNSAYALTPRGHTEFDAAVPQIYLGSDPDWDGQLRLAFPEQGADRSDLDLSGFALLSAGILLSPRSAPPRTLWVQATGPAQNLQRLAARAWPLARLGEQYAAFTALFAPLRALPAIHPIDAMAGRTVLIHAWRRIALRDPHLPAGLLPPDWPGTEARKLCILLYKALAGASEEWLDSSSAGEFALPPGPDPMARFGVT